MVECMKLVVASLAIFNFLVNVSPQEKLEHPLPTNCLYKSYICGDKCFDFDSVCDCGGATFDVYDDLYCCILRNETCMVQDDKTVSCENGQALSIYGDSCNECPISPRFSTMALTSNCSKRSNHFCPIDSDSSKICMDKVNVSITDYCSNGGNDDYWKCPKANEGLDFEQCYAVNKLGLPNKMNCISRIDDKDRNLFQQEKEHRRRWNLYSQIAIENDRLKCLDKTYGLTEICSSVGIAKPCTLLDTKEVVDLVFSFSKGNFKFDLCHDFSFWKAEIGRCIPKEMHDNNIYYAFPPLCNRTEFNCLDESDNLYFKDYCPNRDESCEMCGEEKHFFCNKSKTCITKEKTCDGIFHCLYGEDEMFEVCKATFPEEATVQCVENRLPGTIDVTIMAIPCDGIVECRDGGDENCDEDKLILVISVGVLFLTTICIYLYLVLVRLPFWKRSVFREFEVDDISSKSKPSDCSAMKGNRLAKLKNNVSQKQCADALAIEGAFSNIKKTILKKFFGPITQQIFDPVLIILPQMDFLKDIILVVRLITLLGGIVVFTNPQLFSSNVTYLLLATIFIPQYLGTISYIASNPPRCNDIRQITYAIFVILLSPLFSYVQHFKGLYLELKLRVSPNDQTYIKAKEDFKRTLNRHIKLELGLETVYQLSITLILLLLSYTKTPVEKGLKTVFNEGLGALPLFLLTVSNILSAKSFTSSHCKVLNVCREHFPFTSRLVASLYSLCGLITRVVAMITYFTVPLGLFSLLRHWQGEQVPWNYLTLDFVTPEGLMFLGDNEGFMWNEVDRWIKNGTLFDPGAYGGFLPNPDYFVAPPDITLYIGLTWHPYLYIFFVHVAIHSIVIFIAKFKLSLVFRYGFNLVDKIIHSLENTNLTFNCREWDDGAGDAEEHRRRMHLNWIEGLVIIIINSVFNTSLMVPLYYLVYKMQERHDILSRTIGYLDEEQEALDRGYLLLICSTVTLVVGSLLQILFFFLYNGPFHPFANILVDEDEDQSFPKPIGDGRNIINVNESPSDCDGKTQMEDVQGFVKEPLEEDNDKEQEKALPLPSQNETEV